MVDDSRKDDVLCAREFRTFEPAADILAGHADPVALRLIVKVVFFRPDGDRLDALGHDRRFVQLRQERAGTVVFRAHGIARKHEDAVVDAAVSTAVSATWDPPPFFR